MIWILLYVAYALIQGASFVRWYERYTYTRFVWPHSVHQLAWSAVFAPCITAAILVVSLEYALGLISGKVTR